MEIQKRLPRLEAHQVSYYAGTRALVEKVSIAVRSGEILALVGPNGAGKSTLLQLLVGDLYPSSGSILLDGHPLDIYSAKALALQRAVLPQQTALRFNFNAREVVAMGRSPHIKRFGSETERDLEIIINSMERTETTHLAARTFPSLSGGEQGLVSLARVLAQDTPILVLDEPTAALDIHHQELIMTVAQQMAQEGAAVLMVLHDLNLAAHYAHRLALLASGELIAQGEPWEVLTEPILSKVFGHAVAVTSHPLYGCPLVMPLPYSPETHAVNTLTDKKSAVERLPL